MRTLADVAMSGVALAVLCAAIALVINGVRNALYAYAIARQIRQDQRMRALQERVDRLEARSDFFAKQLIKIRLRTMTAEDLARGDEMLLADLQSAGPGGSSPPGPRDHQSPPASRDSEGKA